MKRSSAGIALFLLLSLVGCSADTGSENTGAPSLTTSGTAETVEGVSTSEAAATTLAVTEGTEQSENAGQTVGTISIVTTTPVLTDFVRNLGGDRVSIYPVLKANVDPHDYEATPADIEAMASAGILVKNGVGLEKWFDATVKSSETKGLIVDASTGVALRSGDGSDEEAAGDPHIWQNPRNAKIMATNITKSLIAVDPANEAYFSERLAEYVKELDGLDAEVEAQLSGLTNKKIVTNHDAFGYFIDRYKLDFVGAIIPSFDSQAELSPADVNTLVAKIRTEGVRAIFSESSLPAKTAKALASEAGVRVVAGEGSLYGDSLGPDGSDGDTYLKMIRHNTKEIVDNLS